MKKIVVFICILFSLVACQPKPSEESQTPKQLTVSGEDTNQSTPPSGSNTTYQMNGDYYSKHFNQQKMIGAIDLNYAFEQWPTPMVKPSAAIVKNSQPGTIIDYTIDNQITMHVKAPASWTLSVDRSEHSPEDDKQVLFTRQIDNTSVTEQLLVIIQRNEEGKSNKLLTEAVNENAKVYDATPKLSQYYFSYSGDYLYKYMRFTGTYSANQLPGYVYIATKETEHFTAMIVGQTFRQDESFDAFEKEMLSILEDIHVEIK